MFNYLLRERDEIEDIGKQIPQQVLWAVVCHYRELGEAIHLEFGINYP